MTTTNRHHDGHNHDDQLDEIYPTMLNELTVHLALASLLWPSWPWFVAVMV